MRDIWVKALYDDGTCRYYRSLYECCESEGIRYTAALKKLIEEGGLAPDGRTFFDYPTEWEIEDLERNNEYLFLR